MLSGISNISSLHSISKIPLLKTNTTLPDTFCHKEKIFLGCSKTFESLYFLFHLSFVFQIYLGREKQPTPLLLLAELSWMCSAPVPGAKVVISCTLVMNKAEVSAVWTDSVVLAKGIHPTNYWGREGLRSGVISHLNIIFCFIYCSTW